MPNSLAFLVVFAYPLVALAFFRLFRPPVAAATTIIAGYLLLPTKVQVDLPALPALDKDLIPAMAVILCASYISFSRRARSRVSSFELKNDYRALNGWMPRDTAVILLLTLLMASSFLTGLANREAVVLGEKIIKGLNTYDMMSATLDMIVMLVPLLVGRRLFAHPENQKALLGLIAFAGFLYAWLALVEIWLSPQLNTWLYGFFPHSFVQHVRSGGYRPTLFLVHGLAVATFLAMAFLAAIGAYRCSAPPFPRFVWLIFACWIFLILTNSNSLGGIVLALIALPMVLFLPPAVQIPIALGVATCVLLYPLLRTAGFIPVDAIATAANSIDPMRAQSFLFRIEHEQNYLDHAEQRPLFGWGGFARFRPVVDGREATAIPDGYWVIVLSVGGYFRYLSEFGLITYGLLRSGLKRKTLQIGIEGTTIMMMLAINLIDLIMNATVTPITWLLVGSVLGRLELARAGNEPAETRAVDATRIGGRARHREDFLITGRKYPQLSSQKNQFSRTQNTKLEDFAGASASGNNRERSEPSIGSRHTRFAQTHSRATKQARKPVHRPPNMR